MAKTGKAGKTSTTSTTNTTSITDLSVNIAGMRLKNPVIAASGTYGFGREYSEYYDLDLLGGICVKGLTLEPRKGNKPPRIAETPSGMLNSIGLQNPGIKAFIDDSLPFLRKYDVSVIANIAGNTPDDYCKMAEIISDSMTDAIELNLSCPNVKKGCALYGSTAEGTSLITSAVRKYCRKPLIVKLTPNVTNIVEIALAAESAGADAVSLINTLLGMAIDAENRRPVLANVFGGLSGPAIKPVALRMVYEVCSAIKIPVIGMGGIINGTDAIEFILAGASAVMAGTANFTDPYACPHIIEGIELYMIKHNYHGINEFKGGLILNGK